MPNGTPTSPATPAEAPVEAPQAAPTPAGAPAEPTAPAGAPPTGVPAPAPAAPPTPPPTAPAAPPEPAKTPEEEAAAEAARMEKSVGVTKGGDKVTADDPAVQALVAKGLSVDAAIGNVIGEKNKVYEESVAAGEAEAQPPGAQAVEQGDFAATEGTGTAPGPSIPTEMSDGFAELDAEAEQLTKMYDDMAVSYDSRTKSQVDQIKAMYARRKEQMKVVNQARLGSMTKAGMRAGRARYAKEVETSILSAEERAGIQRLSDLDREESMLIQQAEDANTDVQFKLLNDKMARISEVRAKKSQLIAQQHQMAMEQEDLMMKKAKSAREDAKFELDVIKFQDEMQQNNFDRALSVAKNNGYKVGFDVNGNLDVLQELTMENQIKADSFQLQVDKFGWSQTMDQFKSEMQEKNFYLDTAKFEQSVAEFGMDYAIKEANFNMEQQGFYQDRSEKGFPTSYDQLGMLAPGSKVASAVGQAISDKYTQGNWGDWCVTFTHKVVDFPPVGDYWKEKKAAVDRFAKNGFKNGGTAGVNKGFRQGPAAAKKWVEQNVSIGDVLISDGGDVSSGRETIYGHGMVVTGIRPDGSLEILESNRRGNKKISKDRVMTPDQMQYVYGFIRGELQDPAIRQKAEELAAQNMYESAEGQFGGPGGASLANLSKEDKAFALKMQDSVRKDEDIKGYIAIRDAYQRVVSAGKNPSAANDMALVFNFMKTMDPGSTVREGEFQSAANAAGLGKRMIAAAKKIDNGELLHPDQRADFLSAAKSVYQPKYENYQRARSYYEGQITTFGLDPSLVMRDYAPAGPDDSQWLSDEPVSGGGIGAKLKNFYAQ